LHPDKFVKIYGDLRARPPASDASKSNVRKWLQVHKDAIADEEAAFADAPFVDLMDVVIYPRSPLHRCLEKLGVFKKPYFPFFQRTESTLPQYATAGMTLYADETIDKFVNVLLCVLGFVMLAVPLWVLFALENRKSLQLGVITLFIGVFLLAVQGVSEKARPFESLAATAA
jgi:uncharacterized membrane protein